jgi:hypothetical protein
VNPSAGDRLLPVHQASVVQVSAEAHGTQGPWVGRGEHAVSGEARHCQTLDDLLGCMAQMLTGALRAAGRFRHLLVPQRQMGGATQT